MTGRATSFLVGVLVAGLGAALAIAEPDSGKIGDVITAFAVAVGFGSLGAMLWLGWRGGRL